nr:hypothetical protein [Deltaproteobacteria bacterium]
MRTTTFILGSSLLALACSSQEHVAESPIEITSLSADLPPPDEEGEPIEIAGDRPGGRMTLDEGKAGKKDSDRVMSRAEAIEAARTAGMLGATGSSGGGIGSLTGTGDLSSGFD